MLHRNMNTMESLLQGLDDLLADLQHARRSGELGRLALLSYCEVRNWARRAGESQLADHSRNMFTEQPHISREAFLNEVDSLIMELEEVRPRLRH